MTKLLFTASTLPASDTDPVPAFVKDEAIWFKKVYPNLQITVLAPHNGYGNTKPYSKHEYYDEYRFHYFWPFRWERLTGRGIQPALKNNKLLYFELPGLFFFEFLATWRIARRIRPDLLYAHWFTPQALTVALVAKIMNIPMVFDTQSSDVIILKKIPFSRQIVNTVCRMSVAYTAPSQQTAKKLLYFATDKNRSSMSEKLRLIPLGTTAVPVNEKLIKEVQKKYDLLGKKMIYFIGRLVDRKGIDILIKAFHELYLKDSSLRLVIVGDGQAREEFQKLADDLGIRDAINFAGFVTGGERFALLNLASIGVIPSVNVGDHGEGLPIVFMEGVTAGKVMVISDATGAHEYVVDGRDAFIAKAGSVSDLKKKIDLALNVSAKHDKAFYENITTLAERFQWPTIIKQRYEAFEIDKLKTRTK